MRAAFLRRTLLGWALLAGAACSNADAPAEPVWSKQPCDHCTMIVSDRRYAAQLVWDGDRRFFDDVGCMVLWMEEHAASGARAWVRDPLAGTWIDARSARYATGAKTPMDYGFEARTDGPVGWEAVRDQVSARARREQNR